MQPESVNSLLSRVISGVLCFRLRRHYRHHLSVRYTGERLPQGYLCSRSLQCEWKCTIHLFSRQDMLKRTAKQISYVNSYHFLLLAVFCFSKNVSTTNHLRWQRTVLVYHILPHWNFTHLHIETVDLMLRCTETISRICFCFIRFLRSTTRYFFYGWVPKYVSLNVILWSTRRCYSNHRWWSHSLSYCLDFSDAELPRRQSVYNETHPVSISEQLPTRGRLLTIRSVSVPLLFPQHGTFSR